MSRPLDSFYQRDESENEEEEAIQKLHQQNQRLNEADVIPDIPDDIDFEDLEPDEKEEIVQRDSPELLGALQDMHNVIEEYNTDVLPRLNSGDLNSSSEEYLQLKNKFLKLYSLHLAYYLMLKSKGKPVLNHPVLKTLKTFKGMLMKFKTKEKESIKNRPKRTTEEEVDMQDKRPATRDILKYKGLKRKRKKEERNVRVKNRMKYEKAVKKRRSTYGYKEKEYTDRYDGEATGIRTELVKSVRFQSKSK